MENVIISEGGVLVFLKQWIEEQASNKLLLLSKVSVIDALLKLHKGIESLKKLTESSIQESSADQISKPDKDPFKGNERLRALYQEPEIKELQAQFGRTENLFQAHWADTIKHSQDADVGDLHKLLRRDLETLQLLLTEKLNQKKSEVKEKESTREAIEQEYVAWERKTEALADELLDMTDPSKWAELSDSNAEEEQEILARRRKAELDIRTWSEEIAEMDNWQKMICYTLESGYYLPRVNEEVSVSDLLTFNELSSFNAREGSQNFTIATPNSVGEKPIEGVGIMKGESGAIVFLNCDFSQWKEGHFVEPNDKSSYTLISKKDLLSVVGAFKYNAIAEDIDAGRQKWRKIEQSHVKEKRPSLSRGGSGGKVK